MKLTSSQPGNFFKFKELQDCVEGTFVSYTRNVPGRFGAENVLVLRDDHDREVSVRCTANLARIIEENIGKLPGHHLTITFVETRPTTKGSPLKLFDVEIDDDRPSVAPMPPPEFNDTDKMPY